MALLWSDFDASCVKAISSHPWAPLHSYSHLLMHCPGFLWYTKGSTGMLSQWPGVCSHRVQWFEVIWTLWRWSKCFVFATVPLQLLRDSVEHSHVNQIMGLVTQNVSGMSRTKLDGDGSVLNVSWFGLCFMGCMLCFKCVCHCGKKNREVLLCGWLSVWKWVFLFVLNETLMSRCY